MVMMMNETTGIESSNNNIKNVNNNTSNNNNNDCDFGSEFTEDEFEVANILLDLPYLITKSLPSYRFPFTWAAKRPRSAVVNPPPPKKEVAPPLRPPQPPAATVSKAQPTSPDSPLVFSPTESDAKSTHRKTPVKKTREELQRMVDEKLQTQQTLKQEIEKVKLHLEKVKLENHELKTKKHKVMELGMVDMRREKAQLEACECIPAQFAADNDQIHAGPATSMLFCNQAPLMSNNHGFFVNPAVRIEQGFRGQVQLYESSVGPLGFDLNVPAEEMMVMENGLQPLDQQMVNDVMMNRAVKAEARRKRMLINKCKKLARDRG